MFVLQEFGHPHVLLQDKGGAFWRMVEQTGPAMAETLRRIAQQVSLKASCGKITTFEINHRNMLLQIS